MMNYMCALLPCLLYVLNTPIPSYAVPLFYDLGEVPRAVDQV